VFDLPSIKYYTKNIITKITKTKLFMSFTYNPKTKKRKRTHGFRTRQKTKKGRQVLARRRRKKRHKLTV